MQLLYNKVMITYGINWKLILFSYSLTRKVPDLSLRLETYSILLVFRTHIIYNLITIQMSYLQKPMRVFNDSDIWVFSWQKKTRLNYSGGEGGMTWIFQDKIRSTSTSVRLTSWLRKQELAGSRSQHCTNVFMVVWLNERRSMQVSRNSWWTATVRHNWHPLLHFSAERKNTPRAKRDRFWC